MDQIIRRFFITGSSGFVGSRLIKQLLSKGNKVWGLDVLPSPLDDKDTKYNNYQHSVIDLTSPEAEKEIAKLLDENKIQMVIHLASLIKVGEGEKQPERYKNVNIKGTEIILKAMKVTGLKKIIFASSAAVYQSPTVPYNQEKRLISTEEMLEYSLEETDPLGPVSVYGRTKLVAEELIQQYIKSNKFEGIAFRFFNVSGGKEIHQPSVHLIPIIIDKLIQGEPVKIFGKNYSTSDGTCYRDYFHVNDLNRAILRAIQKWFQIFNPSENVRHFLSFGNSGNLSPRKGTIKEGEIPGWKVYNLGQGVGYTVLQVFRQVSNQYSEKYGFSKNDTGSMIFAPRRQGDPPILLANCEKIKRELGWVAESKLRGIITDTLEEMIDSADKEIKAKKNLSDSKEKILTIKEDESASCEDQI